jgi:hypothetical protein
MASKEFFDEHVMNENTKPDWNEMAETSSVKSDPAMYETPRPGNLTKWSWRGFEGRLPDHVARKVYEKGVYFSSTPDLVNPYTGKRLGVKLTQRDNPYYMVVSNNGKDPAYYATTCPDEYIAIMSAYSSSFVQKASGDYTNWENRVASYNKKFPKNQF